MTGAGFNIEAGGSDFLTVNIYLNIFQPLNAMQPALILYFQSGQANDVG